MDVPSGRYSPQLALHPEAVHGLLEETRYSQLINLRKVGSFFLL